jgi:hypothetical protein
MRSMPSPAIQQEKARQRHARRFDARALGGTVGHGGERLNARSSDDGRQALLLLLPLIEIDDRPCGRSYNAES